MAIKRKRVRRGVCNGLHSSSRFDRTPSSLLRAAETYLNGHDFTSFTEVGRDSRFAVLTKLPGVTVAHVEGSRGRDECAAVLKRWKWVDVTWEVELLSDERLPDRGNHLTFALVVTATHRRTRQVNRWMIVHLPAHIEWPTWFREKGSPDERQQVKAWKDAVETMSQLVLQWQRYNDKMVIHVIADFNLDFRKEWVRAYVDSRFPTLHRNWTAPFPARGTHGKRIIDAWYTSKGAEFRDVTLPPDDNSSDHAPFQVRVLLPQTWK